MSELPVFDTFAEDLYCGLIAAGIDPVPIARMILVESAAVIAAKIGVGPTQQLLRDIADKLPIVKPEGMA